MHNYVVKRQIVFDILLPSNTMTMTLTKTATMMFIHCLHWINDGLILAHQFQRWANIKPSLAQHLVFAGLPLSGTRLYNCCSFKIEEGEKTEKL